MAKGKEKAESKPEVAPAKGGKKLILLVAVPLVLAAAGAGLWFSGVLPGLLGLGGEAHAAAEATHDSGHGSAGKAEAGHGPAPRPAAAPTFFDMPELVANLNAPGRRASYIKLRSKLELAKPEDAAAITQAMPRLLDLFTTYLREIRPEELRGSAGTQRLREELMARANIAVGGSRITDVLFQELLVQ